MANSRRVEKLAALLKREVSELLVNSVRDERVHQAMITITSVEVSGDLQHCLLYTSPSPRDATLSRMPSSA